MYCTTMLHLPPGSQVAIQNIAEAYQIIPIKLAQWPGIVVHISQSQFAIDKCLGFGCLSLADVYGNLADASVDIFRIERIGPISKWVDNFIFFYVPISQVSQYNQTQLRKQNIIELNGGTQRDKGCLWFKGAEWPDGSLEEFDDNCQHLVKALLANDHAPNQDIIFTYTLD